MNPLLNNSSYKLSCFCLLTIFILAGNSDRACAQETSSCISCHLEEVDDEHTELVESFMEGVHQKRGISCVDCHGGNASAEDMDDAMDSEAGYIGAPARENIPEFCASCHADPGYMRGFNPNLSTDQYSKYLISGHGRLLKKSGDKKVAVCTSCHGVHGILASNDPLSPTFTLNVPYTCASCHSDSVHMSGRGIPVTQFSEYELSVHGRALLEKGDRAAPSCAGCHGSHEARRPDPSGVANTCAQCHNYIRELFVSSPHKKAHDENDYPECEVCHGNHAIVKPTDSLLYSAGGGVCGDCHESDSKGMLAAKVMRHSIDLLKANIDSAWAVIEIVRQYGMDTEEPEYQIRQARNKLVQSRAVIHAFSPEKVNEVTQEGNLLAKEAGEFGQDLLSQYDFRRKGFILSVIVILALSFLLTIKIRSLKNNGDSSKKRLAQIK